VWHAPAAACRFLIVAALITIAPAVTPATPRAITIVVRRLTAANACPVTCRRARYPTKRNAAIADVDGA
jgi:hypothetical protein